MTRKTFLAKLGWAGLSAVSALLLAGTAALPAQAQIYRYNPEHRRPVDATIHHLQEIAEHNTFSGKERERYDNAMRHLSQFEERLHDRGSFDKDKLDQAIDDVHNVVDHNPMDGRARDLLRRDLSELRRLRQHFDEHYEYRY